MVGGVLDLLRRGPYDFNFFLLKGKDVVLYKNAAAPLFLENTPYAKLNSRFEDIGARKTHDTEGYRKLAIRCHLEETDALELDLEHVVGVTATVVKADVNCIDAMGGRCQQRQRRLNLVLHAWRGDEEHHGSGRQ